MLRKGLVTAALALTLGAATVAAVRTYAQDDWMPTATAEHRELQASVGTWEGTIQTMYPGAPEETQPAKETVTAFGPFWIHSRFESKFMGMDYAGAGYTGFDPEKGIYVGTWCDNMSSNLAMMKGKKDASGKLVMEWEAPDMTGEMVAHRSETVHTADSYTMDFFMGDAKTMAISMKRVGKGTGTR
jgi:hypothetical protein